MDYHQTWPLHIPMSSPDLTDAEREAVAAVLRTPNLSMGGEILAFEQDVSSYTGSRHAIGVSSGTAGLHLCVRAAGIEAGDWVITTPFSFVASSNVLLYEGAIPVFVDIDPVTGNMDVEKLAQAVTDLVTGGEKANRWLPRTVNHAGGRLTALLPVDVFGQPADWDIISHIANMHSLKVIQDSCEALGAEYKQNPLGVQGDFAVFAFYPNKQITTGEGGLIVTDDDRAAELMRALRNQGRAPGDTWLQHTYLGYNYRLDEMSATLGKVQMGRLDELLAKRQQVADWYTERLTEMPGVQPPQVVSNTTRMSWFVYVVRFEPGIDRDAIAHELEVQGVPARPYFLPVHLQPYMVEKFGYREGDFPLSEDLGQRSLALPFSGVMSETQVEAVCQTLASILQKIPRKN